MGMAASQARYLALLARKSNCEYEGQQINQSRLALSNQSSDLFNQMMALEVPKTPSKSDFTIQKYTFTDGMYDYVIDKWNRLAEADSDGYNYSISYHYDSDTFTGFQKYKLNPQVQFSGVAPTKSLDPDEQIRKLQSILVDREAVKAKMDLAFTTYETQKQQAGKLANYNDSSTVSKVTSCVPDPAENPNKYTIKCNPTGSKEETYVYTSYDLLDEYDQKVVEESIKKLLEYGAIEGDPENYDYSKIYYYKNTNLETDSIAFKSDLDALNAEDTSKTTMLPIYHLTYSAPEEATYFSVDQMDKLVKKALEDYVEAKADFQAIDNIYLSYDVPVKIGNLNLTPLVTFTDNQMTAINQIIADMKEEDIDNNIKRCFDTLQEQYTQDTYKGGIYTFEMVGETYYVSYYDLYNSIVNGTGINNIDDQAKLPYYGAVDMEKPTYLTSRALIEKDQSGRFVTMRLEDDSRVFELKSSSEVDEDAYEDAMNEYDYQKALYDKQVSDLNAKTSIIQKQDQNLELRLKQLDTEQSALNTEIDAVSKVVKDNIEKSFKTFSG